MSMVEDTAGEAPVSDSYSIIDPAIFRHVQSQIDEDTQVREVRK